MKIAEAGRENVVRWHRDLPAFDAIPIGVRTIEAVSRRVQNSLNRCDELWNRYYNDLTDQVRLRLEQEVTRLGADFAYILDESVVTRRDDRTGQAWLHGMFTYMLYGKKIIAERSPDTTDRPCMSSKSLRRTHGFASSSTST